MILGKFIPGLMETYYANGKSIRSVMLEIDAEMTRLGVPVNFNCGKEPCDGTGEPMHEALGRLRDQLRTLEPPKLSALAGPGGYIESDVKGSRSIA
jgi:hypothetical protein